MERRRLARAKSAAVYSIHALCSGPGKLAQALAVDGRDHGRDLCAGGRIRIVPPVSPPAVDTDVRIGISKAAHFPWRFLAAGNDFVSVHPRRSPARSTRKK
jgi:DNA-3-methyladenine glycosylase